MALSLIIVAVSWFFLIAGHYKLLDGVTKWIMIALTTATVAAVIIAAGKPTVMAADFVAASPWNLATLGFIVHSWAGCQHRLSLPPLPRCGHLPKSKPITPPIAKVC